MAQLTQRRISAEHMDDPAASREQMAEALRFIRLVNRRLGGAGAAVREVARLAATMEPREMIRIIDIGTGAADIPVAITQWAKQSGRLVHITAVDLHPVTLDLAREHVAEAGCADVISLEQGDALKLVDRHEPESCDIAHAGMFMHNFQDIEVITLLRIMDRLTKRGVIWNDLLRGWAGRMGVRLMTMGLPGHLKHDARVSVEAGFTKREALDLANRAGLANVRVRTHWRLRFALVGEKGLGVRG
jgi:predicted O-methyltransferase YrrM